VRTVLNSAHHRLYPRGIKTQFSQTPYEYLCVCTSYVYTVCIYIYIYIYIWYITISGKRRYNLYIYYIRNQIVYASVGSIIINWWFTACVRLRAAERTPPARDPVSCPRSRTFRRSSRRTRIISSARVSAAPDARPYVLILRGWGCRASERTRVRIRTYADGRVHATLVLLLIQCTEEIIMYWFYFYLHV
jgi:hypothetical protein